MEQSPEAIWQSVLAVGREAIAASGVPASGIAAIGIANQRETTLLWDARTGAAVGNAIVWQDRRTAAHCDRMRSDGMEQEIAATTGLVVDPYFSSTKLAWLLEQPGIRQRAEDGELRFGTVDSFLVWRLTNGQRHLTDATNASRTQLFDIGAQSWGASLLDYFHVPAPTLPAVRDCVDDFGSAAAEWFGAPIPIRGVAGDQHAALIGQACLRPGQTKCTYGSGCFLVANTGSERVRSRSKLLTTMAYRCDGEPTYAVEGSIFNAGVAIKWLRDQLRVINGAEDTEAAARRCGGDSGGVFVVPAFTGLGAPHWNAEARGLISGLTLDTSRDQIITATLQSIAYQTSDLLAALANDGVFATTMHIDGGMAANDWFCKFLADVLGLAVYRPANLETTAVGAGLLASVGAGLHCDLQDAAFAWGLGMTGSTFMPRASDEVRQRWLDGWHAAVQRALL